MPDVRYERPRDLVSALSLLQDGGWTVLAGGTDYYPGLRDSTPTEKLMDVTAIEQLRKIEHADDHIAIGATTTWTDIIDTTLPPAFDGLKLAAREVGSRQIQNRATVAGNLCNASPAADGVPPLLTLNADVELISADEVRRLPLQDFILGNRETSRRTTELVSRILIPRSACDGRASFTKLGARKYLVISIAMVATRIALDDAGRIHDAAIAVGSCSAVAQRLRMVESTLIGGEATASIAERVEPAHFLSLSPIDDVRASATYRAEAAVELVRRCLCETVKGLVV